MHKTEEKLMFGDFFLNFWLQRPNEDQDNAEKNQTYSTTWARRLVTSQSDTPFTPPLRSGRRIACPYGGTPPPAREFCAFVAGKLLAGHLGLSFEALEAFLEPLERS